MHIELDCSQVSNEFFTPIEENDFVVLVIFNRLGQVLLLDQPERKWDLVTETCQAADGDVFKTIKRCIEEEIGNQNLLQLHILNQVYYGEYRKNGDCKDRHLTGRYYAVMMFFDGDQDTSCLSPQSIEEIAGYQWTSLPQLREMIAGGEAEPLIAAFFNEYFGWVY